jgi:hypothetical protein
MSWGSPTAPAFDRQAYSVTARWKKSEATVVNRLEYRVDKSASAGKRTQWVTTNRVNYAYSDDWRFIGKADYSESENVTTHQADARYGEVDLGFAYRPVDHSRYTLLAMYSYLYDLDPSNQNGGLYVDEKGQVISVEGMYELDQQWNLGAKVALKESSIRLDRDQGAFIDAFTQLYILRARYHLLYRWDALAEYRWLAVDATDDRKDGFLVGADYQIQNNFRIGAGYNFTQFNDNLTALNYDAQGWFINLVAMY